MVDILSALASAGVTVIITIHQPRPDILRLMDRMLLLSGNGKVTHLSTECRAGSRQTQQHVARLTEAGSECRHDMSRFNYSFSLECFHLGGAALKKQEDQAHVFRLCTDSFSTVSMSHHSISLACILFRTAVVLLHQSATECSHT